MRPRFQTLTVTTLLALLMTPAAALATATPAATAAFALPAAPVAPATRVVRVAGAVQAGRARPGRVIVLGFDGADYRTTRAMIDAGGLPHLARLAETGTFAPLRSTDPAESAAAWAAINTGLNPAKNGIPSFVGRSLLGTTALPYAFHTGTATRKIAELSPPGLLGVLAEQDAGLVAGGAALLVALLAFGACRLLRARAAVALPVALVLGGTSGYAAHAAVGWVPAEVPGITTNLIQADGFWRAAAEAGVRTIALDAAMAFDRPDVDGARVLAGLGLPDVRGEVGDYFLYTTEDPRARPWPEGIETGTTAGNVYRVAWDGDRILTGLGGPVDFWARGRVRARFDALQAQRTGLDPNGMESAALRDEQRRLKAELDAYESPATRNAHRARVDLLIERLGEGRARVTLDGQAQDLPVGQWSDLYPIDFELNPLVSARAVARARLVRLDEGFELLVGLLSIDPRDPVWWQPVSQPAGFSRELAGWLGAPFETVGWGCLTNPMKDARVSVDTFLADVESKLRSREALTRTVLARDDWDVLFSVFTVTDRVQHVLYRHYDPQHPGHDPLEAAREVPFFGEPTALRDAIPEIYRQMDRVVGEVMDGLREGDTLLLCADHGFASFRREVHLNNWLAEHGFLAVRPDAAAPGAGRLSADVIDWEHTQAYAVGLGGVYLNLEGRERMGIVEPDRADAVLDAIASAFLDTVEALPDGTRARVGADASKLSDRLPGPYRDRCADMQLGFAEPYRVSWATARGEILLARDAQGNAVPAAAYGENHDAWSGDHASVAPDTVTGIFFSSEPVAVPEGGISVLHVAPTILDRMGVPIPADYDAAPLPRR